MGQQIFDLCIRRQDRQKVYQVSVEDSLSIVDKLSSIDMVSATSAGGLAEAMSRTANSARIAGISMDKLLRYIAAVAEVTQADMGSVGITFKIMFARLSNIKIGRMEDEDRENITQSLSDAKQVLNAVGIALRKTATEFHDFGYVFDEIADKWLMEPYQS